MDHEGHSHETEKHTIMIMKAMITSMGTRSCSENPEGHNHEAEMAAGHSDEIILAPESESWSGNRK